jgi:hypothetical protein
VVRTYFLSYINGNIYLYTNLSLLQTLYLVAVLETENNRSQVTTKTDLETKSLKLLTKSVLLSFLSLDEVISTIEIHRQLQGSE